MQKRNADFLGRAGVCLVLLAAIGLSLGLLGCTTQRPANLIEFSPKGCTVEATDTFITDFDAFPVYKSKEFEVVASVYEYNLVLGLIVAIKNNTTKDLTPTDYTIGLADGRDLKPIKMLSREDLIIVRDKVAGVSNRALQDRLIDTAYNNAMKVANMPTKDQLLALLNMSIEKYFSFRPIYAGKTRQGLLCFVSDFTLEYPLTLKMRVKKQSFTVEFEKVEK
ncbi:MAG: hypothetical protein WC901_07215 [Candidatus Margulisiibacteriota bacterium]